MTVQGPYGSVAATVAATGAAAPSYSASAISADVYSSKCGQQFPVQMIKVPVYKHVVHRRPVVYETVSQEVSYVDVPVQHNFEQRDYPQNTVAQCPQPAPVCAPKPSCGC